MKQVIRGTSVVLGLFLFVVSTAAGQSTFETNANAEFGGDWSDATMWTETAGSDLDGIPDDDDTVIIQANHEIFVDSAIPTTDGGGTTSNRAKVSSLTIEAGGVLRPDADATRILEVYGTVLTVNGVLGRGASEDDLILLAYGTSLNISGGGSIDLQRLIKDGSSNTTIVIDTDVNLRRVSGTALYSLADPGADFYLQVWAGATLNVVSGDVALDGSSGSGPEAWAGWHIHGTLQVGGTLFAKTNNTSDGVGLYIRDGGVVVAGAVDASNSTDRFTLSIYSEGTLQLTSGNFDLTGTSASFNFNGTVDYAASGAQTVNHPDASGLGSILKFSGSGTKTLSGAFNVDAGGTIELAGTASVSGTLTYDAGATLSYTGTTAQSVSDEWPSSNGPTNVTLNNASGVTLNADRSLGGTLTFTSGSLTTNGYTVDLGTTGTLSGENNQNRLVGNVQSGPFTGAGTQTFGNLGFTLADAAVGNDDPDGTQITVLRTNGTTGINAFGSNESIACRWRVTYNGSDTFNKNLTLRWFQNDDNGKLVNAMEMWRFDDTENKWFLVSDMPQDASGNPRSMAEDITSFSTYTASDAVNPLPVELVAFEAQADADRILLRWETASETNNAGFEIQRISKHGDSNWEALGFVEGGGTTLEAQTYTFSVDEREAGRHVFRLKQIDFDGTFAYSPDVEITIELPGVVSLSPAYPNPFNPQTQFTLSVAREQQVTVEVFDVLGRRVATLFDGVLTAHQAHAFTFDAHTLPSGLYVYRAVGETFATSRTMMLQK